LQLSGGNDYLNTVIPYTDPLYWDNRPVVNIPEDQIIPLDDQFGFNPSMAPIKDLWDVGKVAIIHGVGWENSVRSHFRAMDVWHTCEPDILGTEGWAGRATRDLDPNKDNVLTAINFGVGLPRALALPGVSVASVSDLSTYGILTNLEQDQRVAALERFERMYAPTIGSAYVMDYLSQTGLDALRGADILRAAPDLYSSTVEYSASPIAKKMKDIAQVHLAGFGTRIFYTQHAGFDTHATELKPHAQLWKDVSEAVYDFYQDLREHDDADNVVVFMFTEFGRRVHDNGSGTDHGAGGAAFAIGDPVVGGYHNEYPSRKPEDLQQGDLVPSMDFRSLYSTLLEDWLGLDAKPIVGGSFEKPGFIKK
jgi:uncharacterized protein (DUF1501 family)